MRLFLSSEGELGEALAELVACLAPSWKVVDSPSLADMAFRFSWRDVATEFGSFADLVDGLPWLSVAYSDPFIRIGPLIRPEHSPCYSCYLARVRQHDVSADSSSERAYLADRSLGVRGHAPHHLAMAAGHALALAESVEPGEVRLLDCATDQVARVHVVPVAGCVACDVSRTGFAMGVAHLRAMAGGTR